MISQAERREGGRPISRSDQKLSIGNKKRAHVLEPGLIPGLEAKTDPKGGGFVTKPSSQGESRGPRKVHPGERTTQQQHATPTSTTTHSTPSPQPCWNTRRRQVLLQSRPDTPTSGSPALHTLHTLTHFGRKEGKERKTLPSSSGIRRLVK